jgi:hypothetical protein
MAKNIISMIRRAPLKYKIMAVLVVLLLGAYGLFVFVSNSYLGVNENKNIDYATPDDVKMTLMLENERSFKNNSSLQGKLIIKNIVNKEIRISKYFIYGDHVQFFMKKNSSNFISSVKTYNYCKDDPVILSPGESIEFTFNLYNYTFYRQDGKQIEWPDSGTYSIYAKYKSNFTSNSVQFEII